MRLLPRSVSSRASPNPWRITLRIADHGNQLDLSAFLVVALYTFRNISVFKLSAVIRTIAMEATIYFLAMVALQIYSQLSFALMEV